MQRLCGRRIVGLFGIASLVLAGYAVWVPRKTEVTIRGTGNVRMITRIGGAETRRIARAPVRFTVPSVHFSMRIMSVERRPIGVTAEVRSVTRSRVSAVVRQAEEIGMRVAGANIVACKGSSCLGSVTSADVR